MASTAALSAAAQDRKVRLAQLKSLKRKHPDSQTEPLDDDSAPKPAKSPRRAQSLEADVTTRYLSGRNYDPETKGPKLGFETAPSEDMETLEKKAAALAEETKRQREEEEKADKPLDLFKLQPKKPNWDLKRDLDLKMEILNVRTENAMARLVRERIANAQKVAQAKATAGSNGTGIKGTKGRNGAIEEANDGEAVGMEGASLVEATNVREREDQEDARREREKDAALVEAT